MSKSKYIGFVYITTNIINNKKYIGKCLYARKNGWKNYLGSGVYFKRALNKYGRENFKREIIFLALEESELNEIEEFVIDFHGAVKSNEFYNIKHTSIGGDTFTNSPKKEQTRELYRQSRKGKNNGMYGRKTSKSTIESIKEANSVPIIVDGKEYRSIIEYSLYSGVKPTTIGYRLSSNGFPEYVYKNKQKEKSRKPIKRTPILIDGVEYRSIYSASKELGIYTSTINRRLKSSDFPNYRYM